MNLKQCVNNPTHFDDEQPENLADLAEVEDSSEEIKRILQKSKLYAYGKANDL